VDEEERESSVFGDFVSRLTPYEGEEPDDAQQAVNLELARQQQALGVTPDDPRYETWLEYASTVRRAVELREQLIAGDDPQGEPGQPASE
jgi:hypothetical protein